MNKKCEIKYIVFILLVYIFTFQNVLQNIFYPFRYFDEFISILCFFVGLIRIIKKRNIGIKIDKYDIYIIVLTILLLLIGICPSIVYKYQSISIVLSDIVVIFKFFMMLAFCRLVFDNDFINNNKARINLHAKIVIIILFISTIINYCTDFWPVSLYRFGIKSNQLFYEHPTYLVSICVFLLAIFNTTNWNNKSIKSKIYYLMSILIIFSTLRFKAIGAAMIIIFIVYYYKRKSKKISLVKLGILSLILIAISWNQIRYYYFDIKDSARKTLSEASIKIANEYAPFGSGFGTFGSYYSTVNYSPIYYKYQLNHIHGLMEGKAYFVSDVFWPMILGQFGYIGLAIYILLLLFIYMKIQSEFNKDNKMLYYSKMICFIYLLISSTSESAFAHPMAIPLALIIGIYYNKGDKNNLQEGSNNMSEKKLNGTVIVTYRCNARCTMCNRYKCPSKPDEEISLETIKKLPKMYFTNITGGEPFIREDLQEVVEELYKKSDRIVISTNGFFTDRIIAMAKRFPNIGIRISIEGLEKTNNEIRGLKDGYKKGYETLKKLKEMGMKDVGFGMTVQDKNAPDLVPLYEISNEMDMEFATASLHNSFYFVEAKNIIHDRPMVAQNFENLINRLLNSKSPKKWFRAYFNHGLINYIYGQKRLLPCDMAFDTFFIDPYGDVMPCNGTKDKEVMGNLNTQTWDELWNSEQAEKVRNKVRHCDRQCWMIGSVSPAMHKYIWKPAWWVIRHKLKFWTKKKYSMYELKIVRDYRDGKVSKEELDKCSTCDLKCIVKDGLSEESKKQLKNKTGEEIVDADLKKQMKNK